MYIKIDRFCRGGAPPAESGAYIGQRGERRDVPRADVRAERLRRLERLRAEPHALHAGGECSHVSARTHMRRSTHRRAGGHTQARTRSRIGSTCTRSARVCIGGTTTCTFTYGYHTIMYIYTYISDMCVAMSIDGRTHTGCQRPHRPHTQTAHTCTWRRCSHTHAHTYIAHWQ